MQRLSDIFHNSLVHLIPLPHFCHLRWSPVSDIGNEFEIRWCTTEIHNNNTLFLTNLAWLGSQAQLFGTLELANSSSLRGLSSVRLSSNLQTHSSCAALGNGARFLTALGLPRGLTPEPCSLQGPFLKHPRGPHLSLCLSSFLLHRWVNSNFFEPQPAIISNCVSPGKLLLSVHQAFNIKSKVFGILNPCFSPLRAWFWTKNYTALVWNIELFFSSRQLLRACPIPFTALDMQGWITQVPASLIHGPHTEQSVGIIWKLARHRLSQTPPQTSWIRIFIWTRCPADSRAYWYLQSSGLLFYSLTPQYYLYLIEVKRKPQIGKNYP